MARAVPRSDQGGWGRERRGGQPVLVGLTFAGNLSEYLGEFVLTPSDTLKLLLETSMDAVIVMRPDGTVAEWSDEARRVFGWDREEVLDREMAQFIVPAQYRDQHHAGLHHYLQTGEGPVLRRRIEISGLRRSGEEFPIELSISPVSVSGEEMFLAFVRDVSHAKAAMEELRRQAAESALLHRVSSLAAESQSLDEVIQLCLESICELLGWPVGHAFLARPDAEHLQNHIWAGDLTGYEALVEATNTVPFPRGVGLPGRVWATGQSEWIDDVDSAKRFARGGGKDLNIGAAFAMPITTQDVVVAVLEFFSPTWIKDEPDRIVVAQIMAAQAGRALERERDRQRQLMLLGELDHRTKNLLAVISSMAVQTGRGAGSVEEYAQDFSQRLASLSASHGLLTRSQWGPTNIRALIIEVVGVHLAKESPQLNIQGCELLLPARTALSLGLVFHELATNAVKYGALARSGGRISVTCEALSSPSPLTRIVWREAGVGDCAPPDKIGFGTKLIQTSVRHDLGGSADIRYLPDGVVYEIVFPTTV